MKTVHCTLRPVASMRQVRRLPPCVLLNLEKFRQKPWLPYLQKLCHLMKMKERIFNHHLYTDFNKYYKNITSKLF